MSMASAECQMNTDIIVRIFLLAVRQDPTYLRHGKADTMSSPRDLLDLLVH
jgi:hypothetical protein